MIEFIGKHFSPYLCGFRKGYNAQYALIGMIEKWKKSLDEGGMFAAVLMDVREIRASRITSSTGGSGSVRIWGHVKYVL